MNLQERIKAAQEELVGKKDTLTGVVKALEAEPNDASLLVQVEELTGQIEKSVESIAALQKAEQALASHAAPVTAAPTAPAVTSGLIGRNKIENLPAGDLAFKILTAGVKAHVNKTSVDQELAQCYSHMPELQTVNKSVAMFRKSQINPAMTTTTGWADSLVQESTRGYIDTLKDVSVAAALANMSTSLDFGNFNSITIPRRIPKTGVPTEPAWVAEGAPIPLTKFSFGSMTLNRFKLAAITTMSQEVANRASVDLEMILKDALRDAHAEVLDNALLSNAAAVTNVRPAGLLNGVTLTAGTAGGGEAAIRGDIMALLSKLTAKKLGAKPVIIMNNLDHLAASMMTSALSEYLFRDELSAGHLMGIPVIVSANVPQKTLIMVDANFFVSGFGAPIFDVSDVASVVEASADTTAPTMASTAAGAAGTAGQVGPTEGIPLSGDGRALGAADKGFTSRSLWQTSSLGIRMIAPTSFGNMQPGIVEASATTTWS